MSAPRTPVVCTVLLCLLAVVMGKGGWQPDGTYIGKYPAGCQNDSDCRDLEYCVEDDMKCPAGSNNCRCQLGCMMKDHYLRFQQYREVQRKTCLCNNPNGNAIDCVDKSFDEFTRDLR